MIKSVILNSGALMSFDVYKTQKAAELTSRGFGFIKPADIEAEVEKMLSTEKHPGTIFSEQIRTDINIKNTRIAIDAEQSKQANQQNLF